MAKTIWKTDLSAGNDGFTRLPVGARPISVHLQNGTPTMWSIVDPDAPLEDKAFHIAGTGHPLPNNLGDFIGTFLVADDALVFHVFEIAE